MALLGALILFFGGIVLMIRVAPLMGCGLFAAILALITFGNHPEWFAPFAWTIGGLLALLMLFALVAGDRQKAKPSTNVTLLPPEATAGRSTASSDGMPPMAPRRMEPPAVLRVGFHVWTFGARIEEPPDFPPLPSPSLRSARRRRLK